MRKRKLIPETHTQWLNGYLARKGLSGYPDKLTANQWRLLQGAYRQVLLKEKKPLNNALSNDSKELKLLAKVKRLEDKLSRLKQASLITPDIAPAEGSNLLKHNAVLVSERDKAKAKVLKLESTLTSKERVIDDFKIENKQLKEKLRKAESPVLGEGVYDGAIPLAVAVRLLSLQKRGVTKDSNKQSTLRKEARVRAGYGEVSESKLTKIQRVEIYNLIKTEAKC